MCGIAGIAGRQDDILIRHMTDVMAHRGPDGEGHFSDGVVSLGHCRLSIIDLAGGKQPMSYGNGRYWITYNGEVYNYRELRSELEGLGHVFSTHSDTEVLLAAYAQWGRECVGKLQGMFAFALWDAEERRLFVARDPIGVKPFYYAEINGVFYFASEMKALLLCPGVRRDLDRESLDDYLTYLYTVPPRTIFRDIRQLPPGGCGEWRDGRFTPCCYWRPECPEPSPMQSESQCLEALDDLLADLMKRYRIADVPLGAFLSGGLDSTAIARYLSESGDAPLTFTIGFGAEGARYDESRQARATAQWLGTQHHELTAHPKVAELLPVMVRHFDEPFGNPTALLTYAICELVRDHVVVVMSGDGGDEGFGGYPRYKGMAWAERYQQWTPEPLRRWVVNPLVQCLPESTSGFHALRRMREFSEGSLRAPEDRYARWIGYYTREERQGLYTEDIARDLSGRDAHEPIRRLWNACANRDPVARAMFVDIQSFLPHNVLQYGDRMSMAHSLEVRVPLADPRLFALLLQMPSSLKLRGGVSKYLLRQLLKKKLPDTIVHRRKQGFNPPMGVWLKGPLREVVEEFLSPAAVARAGYFKPQTVSALLTAHRQGRRDYTWHLWSLIVFEQWRRLYLE